MQLASSTDYTDGMLTVPRRLEGVLQKCRCGVAWMHRQACLRRASDWGHRARCFDAGGLYGTDNLAAAFFAWTLTLLLELTGSTQLTAGDPRWQGKHSGTVSTFNMTRPCRWLSWLLQVPAKVVQSWYEYGCNKTVEGSDMLLQDAIQHQQDEPPRPEDMSGLTRLH